MKVLTGLDRVAAGDEAALSRLKGRKLGLVAHPASVDAKLRHAVDVLDGAGCDLRTLFGPEHGYGGAAQDMIGVASSEDSFQGRPLHSLYGTKASELMPRQAWLADLDAVVIDLQDVGARYYTYVWTAAFMLRAAAKAGIPTIVLDRPNPLGGDVVEGCPVRPGYRSFVGLYPVPVRHGMTIAEILEFVRREQGLDEACLEVVPMQGWQRSMYFDETGLPWVLPSPNMPTLDTATVYPGGCVIEGTTLSEGRGQTRPFEIFGAPWVDGAALARDVPIEGATLRPLTFEPTFQKHARVPCGGVQLHVHDRAVFRSYTAYLRLIAAALQQVEDDQAPWRTEEYEYETLRPAIDLLTGGPEYRQAVNAERDLEPLLLAEDAGAAAFRASHEGLLRY